MRQFIFIAAIIGAVLFGSKVQAQFRESRTLVKGVIEPYQLAVSPDKTVNLVFPYNIVSVNRGSADVLAQKASEVGNILQVKCEDENFKPTNLTVVTAEGALYSFLLHFVPNPRLLNLKVADLEIPIQQIAQFEGGLKSQAKLRDAAQRIATKKEVINKLSDKRNDMGLQVKGIYISGDVLYFQIKLDNNSRINYDVAQFRSYLTDSKQAKRTAKQETPLIPLFSEGNDKRIEGNSSNTVVLAFDKFTIPNKKHMVLQVMEQNGGRNLQLKIKNKDILKAKSIN
ncbi:conjugative transposon protein TraN [uncultured Dysgonomonas sp.]|uniref:conjugative transposon protein TraN n=1 Tax=uncultured Dysgonomonas sp. TaxID=206096 RepID=UPI000A80D4B2|nr:conjugative transposon protein TraN [uncultured Dysgonomonas sp.]